MWVADESWLPYLNYETEIQAEFLIWYNQGLDYFSFNNY